MAATTLEQARMQVMLDYDLSRQRLLSPEGLAKLAKNLGTGSFSALDVTGLWKVGLLRADFITTDFSLEDPGLVKLEIPGYGLEYSYCDFRELKVQAKGLGSFLKDHENGFLEESLFFHPFRLYVLHHIERTLKISTSSMQFLRYEPGVNSVVETLLKSCTRWTSSDSFVDRFHYWNQVAETAIVAEPITYDVVFRDRGPLAEFVSLDKEFESTFRELLSTCGKCYLQGMLTDLAFAAVTLDDNRSVHVLMRLMKWREREKLKGHLGAAMHFLSMAESIRRSAEWAFNEAWPEEDEIGPGQWMDGARKILYGNDRVFDAPRSDLRDYLSQLGLDFGVKVRCYVEGDTEYGALSHATGSFDHVQLINLSGNFAEKGGKGLAFAKSLEADKNAGIFSVVVLDGDLDEYLRILRKAAEEDRFHGRFFINYPDIECGNFSGDELVQAALGEFEGNMVTAMDLTSIRASMLAEASSIKKNGDLLALSKANGLTHFRKSESWGKALMQVAIKHPTFPKTDKRSGQQRPIVEVAELLIRMRNIGFGVSMAFERVNSLDGKMKAIK